MTYTLSNPHKFPYDDLLTNLLQYGERVDTGHWQAVRNVPNTRTVELQHILIEVPIQPTVGSWASFCQPNLPWAEDHFQERVAGEPTNPGEEYKNWPWFKPGWLAQSCPGCGTKGQWHEAGSLLVCTVCGNNTGIQAPKFSHTYQERFWPKFANGGVPAPKADMDDEPHLGIRYRYGDLHDVLLLLAREPYTRQAYLPIFFPEDTGAHHGERVPCTLGYHFMLREDKLHCFYPMRSVDLVRYLRDDAYMAGRLVQWIIDELEDRKYPAWDEALPGNLTMFCSSLHVFEDEIPALRRKHAAANT